MFRKKKKMTQQPPVSLNSQVKTVTVTQHFLKDLHLNLYRVRPLMCALEGPPQPPEAQRALFPTMRWRVLLWLRRVRSWLWKRSLLYVERVKIASCWFQLNQVSEEDCKDIHFQSSTQSVCFSQILLRLLGPLENTFRENILSGSLMNLVLLI